MIDLVIDNIIFSLQKSGGVSVVWYELLTRLMNEKNINIGFIEANNNQNHLRKKLGIINNDIILKQNASFAQRYFNPKIKKNNPFIFHSTYYRTCPHKLSINISTVHDFTYEYFSHGIRKYVHSYQKFNAIRKSKYIICVSNNTKKDLLEFLPDVDSNKIIVIPNGVSDDYFLLDDEDELHYNNFTFRKNEYVLYVGSRAKYKNFDIVVDSISSTDFKLVVVGSPLTPFEENYIKKCNFNDRFIYLGNVTNKILNRLYNNAYALIYPSSYEGFGIPVLEAQRAGCPVIAYNKSSIPEVIGDHTLLIDELDKKCILDKLEILTNNDIRKKVIMKGLENSMRYSWDKTYDKLFSLYKNAWEEII
jgi:mannosyltransferase